MAMFKGLMGGAAGAAAYTAYRDSDTIFNSKDLATGLYDYWQRKGATNLAEVSRLQKNVDDLQHALLKTLHDRQQPTVIVAGGGVKSGLNTAAGVVLVVGGVALYFRFVKGWKLTDLMYVTRSSLSSLSEAMKQSMENVRNQVEARAADMMERMSLLGKSQEEMLEAQGQLGDELAVVGDKVTAVSEQVGFSNHAILLLCGALSEMAKRVGIANGKYVRELEHLSRTVATTGLSAGAAPTALTLEPFGSPAALLTQQPASLPPAPGPAAATAAGLPPVARPNPAVFALGGQGSSSSSSPVGSADCAPATAVRGQSDAAVLLGGGSRLTDPWSSSSSRLGSMPWAKG